MRQRFLVCILFIVAGLVSKAQYFDTGQDPASLRWRQINTTNFQLIYPEGFEKQAQRVAYVFEKVYAYSATNLRYSPKKISVVLHTHTVKSNGLVAWAPKRVELYTTPHQGIYAQDWMEQLAIHEFTHVIQLDRVQQELPVIFKILLGEQAAALLVGTYLPFWLIEGDAVTNETAFTKTGRGRMPSFLMENKAQIISRGSYSLSKAYHGSFKDFVPDHYKLGYWLTGKAKEAYGSELFGDAITKSAKNPFILSPVNKVLKKNSGLRQSAYYHDTFSQFEKEWKNEIEEAGVRQYPNLAPERKTFTSYVFGSHYNGHYFALRQSLDDIPRIVSIDTEKNEKVIATPGSLFEESFSSEQNLFIWSENQPDLRWSHSGRSVICIFDLISGLNTRFVTENKVFSPKIAPNKQFYAAVEVDYANNCYLSVFDLKTGKRLHRFATPDNQYFFTPCWNDQSNTLYFIALELNGKYLASWKTGDSELKRIQHVSFTNIKNPVVHNNTLFFVGAYSGIDNVYCLDLVNGDKYQLTSVPFGADYPSVSENGKELLFSNYSADGFQLTKQELDADSWKKLNEFPEPTFSLAENLSKQVQGKLDLQKPDSISYPSKKYSKLAHAINFHSWAPLYIDAENQEFRPGVSLFSQNKLGTSVINLGYDYDTSEKTGMFVAGFKYSGWYPVFKFDLKTGKSASQYYLITQTKDRNGNIVKQDTTIKRFTWNESNFSVNMNLPLNLSSGKWHRLFQPEVTYEYTQYTHDSSTPSQFFSGNYQSIGSRLYFHAIQRQSHQDLQSDWGVVLDANYRFSPSGNIDFGDQYSLQNYLYLPGLSKNHGIRLYNAFQQKKFNGKNAFSDIIRMPRGYYRMQNTRMYSFAADYKLPLLCPDWSLGKLVYIKRIRASVFYDYANLQTPVFDKDGNYAHSLNRSMNSTGLELLSDIHVMRFFAPIEFGVRTVYRPEFNDFQFDMLFSIDFTGF